MIKNNRGSVDFSADCCNSPQSGVFLINNAARRAVLGTAFSCKRSLIEGQKTRKKG